MYYKVILTTLFQTLNLGMIGPSLLDFESQTGATTSQLSTVFTWRAILGLTASLLLGRLLDKGNRYLLTGCALLMAAIFIAIAPWFTQAQLLIAFMSPPEFFNGLIGMGKLVQQRSTLSKVNIISTVYVQL